MTDHYKYAKEFAEKMYPNDNEKQSIAEYAFKVGCWWQFEDEPESLKELNFLRKENTEIKAQIEKIKKIMNLNDYCENVYHYLSCELDLYKADSFDCEVCRYDKCSKRQKQCELDKWEIEE